MKNELFERVVEKMQLISDSGAKIMIEERFPDTRLVGGKYHLATGSVYLYKEELAQQCLQLFGSLNRLEEYIAVVCAHELGHAEDRELVALSNRLDEEIDSKERAEVALRIEENAWRYARSILRDIDTTLLDMIVDESLSAYRRTLQSAIA